MKLPRYPKYKDSGVKWLGQVPEHWDIDPLFSVAEERNESNRGMLEDNLLSLSYGRIIQKDIDSNDGLLPESFETYQLVHPGDIVFRLTDLQNDKCSLRTALVGERGIITSAYLALIPIKVQSQFVNFLLRAYDLTKVFYSMGGGLRQSLKFSDMKRLPILIPPPREQSGIVAFLNRETEKIDVMVKEQQRLIELLKEKRQAIISHAVTKGLNPNAPMKPSGIDWIGDIPAHWQMIPLRWKSRCTSGGSLATDEISESVSSEKGIPVIGGNGVMGYTDKSNTFHPILVIGRVGALCGNVHQIKPPAWITDNALMLDVNLDTFDLTFLAESLRSRNLNNIASKTAQPLITGTQVKDQRVPCPRIEEQLAITAHISREAAKLDDLISKAQNGIELLQERRSALITAAVSGQIDVRGERNAVL